MAVSHTIPMTVLQYSVGSFQKPEELINLATFAFVSMLLDSKVLVVIFLELVMTMVMKKTTRKTRMTVMTIMKMRTMIKKVMTTMTVIMMIMMTTMAMTMTKAVLCWPA